MSEEDYKHYLNDLNEYLQDVKKTRFYTLQRLDVLIILLSTSGIFFLTTATYSVKQPCLFVLSLLAFVLSIILNLLSQFFAYLCNNKYLNLYMKKIYDLRYKKEVNEEFYKGDSKKAKRLNKAVEFFNYSSLFFLIAGIIVSFILLLKVSDF